MYVMTGEILFPEIKDKHGKSLVIRHFSEVHIERTFKQFTQFAEVLIPKAALTIENKDVNSIFKVGMEVVISLGYDGANNEEFRGYITRVSADIPVVIRIEDEMWKAKRIAVNYVGSNLMLSELLSHLAVGYEVDALEVKIGDVRFSQTNLGAVLELLQSEWKLYSYFEGKKLICGKYYSEHTGEEAVRFDLESNVVSSDLTYRNKEDVILKIDATSFTSNGDKVTYSIGDEGGDQLQLAYYGISQVSELEEKVKIDYERAKRGGFDGGFTAFGIPFVAFGKKVKMTSSLYPDRDGMYYVEGVNKTFNKNGFRQNIKLGGVVS